MTLLESLEKPLKKQPNNMQKARTVSITALLAVFCLAAALIFPKESRAAAGGMQTCVVGESCTVGEFLYDDEYNLLNTATCTITSRYPDGTLFLDGEGMSLAAENDGWYSKSFTAPATTGYYRTQVCCTASGEDLCIDKSFEVKESTGTSSEIADAVWNHSGRTLSSFGTLTSDVWNYSTRTVTSFGDLISNIWDNATRTLTGSGLSSGSIATKEDLKNATSSADTADSETLKLVKENRLLLEQVVNKPIIENVLEEELPDLGVKLEDTKAMANQVYVNNQYLTSQAGTLASKWNVLSGKELLDGVMEIADVLGEKSDSSSSNTIFGQVNWLRDSWDWSESDSIYEKLVSAKERIDVLQNGLSDYRKDPALYFELKRAVRDFIALEEIIGTSSDGVYGKTLYSRIKTTQDMVASLDQRAGDVNKLLANFSKSEDVETVAVETEDVQKQVIAINKIPGVSRLLTRLNRTDAKSVKNRLFSLLGIINSNKKLLAKGAGRVLANTWLEEGSIVFKTLVTNPSSLISQTVKVKYYLPSEIKEEDIISVDQGLETKYDSEKNRFYVEGEFKLAADETRTFSVRVSNIWVIKDEEIESLRRQADELYKPLEKTAFLAQAVSLKSDINASLDRIESLQDSAVTPEQKIKAYREAVILKKAVEEKLNGMKELVAQASSAGSLLGFVGGAQTIGVWGLVIVIAAAFVFMAVYMKTITNKAKEEEKSSKDGKVKKGKKILREVKGLKRKKMETIKLVAILIVSSLASALIASFVVSKLVAKGYKDRISVLENNIDMLEKRADASKPNVLGKNDLSSEEDLSGNAIGGVDNIEILVPLNGKVEIMEEPSMDSDVVDALQSSSEAIRIEEKGEWVKILIGDDTLGKPDDKGKQGWVRKNFVKDSGDIEDISLIQEGVVVEIENTPTGWLRVRRTPRGEIIGKVNVGEEYLLVEDGDGWYRIVLDNGDLGWVSKEYSSKI